MADFDDDDAQTQSAHRPRALHLRRARLLVLSGPDARRHLDFDGQARVGTRALADLMLRDPKVSGLHCEIVAADDGLRVRDLGSKNGTFLGDYCVFDARLSPNDVLTVGDTRIRVSPIEGTTEVPLHAADDVHGLVGASPAMRALMAQLARLAASDTTTLIQGETGTGKERVAEALHLAGPRAQHPLVTVDCSALPGTLIESELFGHERGAFTGAVASLPGAFERAQRGTLFLDEIGELPLMLQPKLLRALESRTVRRLGGQAPIRVDARVLAATNRDLALEVAAGRFREDLYHRLAVVVVTVPPLRERLDDLPLLVGHLCGALGVDPAPLLAPGSLALLRSYRWPGNVRELRNVIERTTVLSETLSPDTLRRPGAPGGDPDGVDIAEPIRLGRRRRIDAYERAYVSKMLAACGGNISEAARRAGLERISFYRIIQRLRLRDS